MSKRAKKATAPAEYAYLGAAFKLGADLRPAFHVLLMFPDTRKDVTAWLLGLAAAGDPAVGVYLDMAGALLWDDHELRREVVKVLDEFQPDLARRRVTTPMLVVRADAGYWAGWGYTDDIRQAKLCLDRSECWGVLVDLDEQGVKATPEFFSFEDCWRKTRPRPEPDRVEPDPWGRALEAVRVVPGCAWVSVSPAVREELERAILVQFWVEDEPALYKDILRAAARFGHPLYTVFVDLSARQRWCPAFREELVRLDRLHALFRDPPGDVPVLQPMEGPYKVVCGEGGFWTGSRWSASLAEAEKFPARNGEYKVAVKEALRRAEELTGVPGVEATVKGHVVRQQGRNRGG